MAAITALALFTLWGFWPAPSPTAGPAPARASFIYFSWRLSLTRDQQFFLIVAMAGVLGAMLHGLRSMARYVGERQFIRSWTASYLFLPFIGAVIATIVYLVLRAGLLPGATSGVQPDPYGISAIAALVGWFSAQAAEKMKDVFETMFRKPEAASDSIAVSPSAANPPTAANPPAGASATAQDQGSAESANVNVPPKAVTSEVLPLDPSADEAKSQVNTSIPETPRGLGTDRAEPPDGSPVTK
jgi:hypothetical protein